MKAVILAAGLGSRLRPITNEIPKCMVPVNGIRIIDKQIDNLMKAVIKEVYVVSSYKHDVLDAHLKAHTISLYQKKCAVDHLEFSHSTFSFLHSSFVSQV